MRVEGDDTRPVYRSIARGAGKRRGSRHRALLAIVLTATRIRSSKCLVDSIQSRFRGARHASGFINGIACEKSRSYIRDALPYGSRARGYCVSSSRREFLKSASVAAATIGVSACTSSSQTLPSPPRPSASPTGTLPDNSADPTLRDLALLALDVAKSAGAQYADVRISRNRVQNISTRERRVQALVDNETFGFGVRTLVGGAWGFAASSDLTRDEVTRVSRQSVALAQANRSAQLRPVELAPAAPTPNGVWRSAARVDPFDVSIEDKVALLLAANEAALKVQGARFVNSAMFFLREEKTYANSDGTFTVQTLFRTQPSITITAVAPDGSDCQGRQSDVQPMGRGYEHVLEANLVDNATKWATEAVQKLSARPVEVGRYDLVLHPTHLGLTIHEAIAHPTEL